MVGPVEAFEVLVGGRRIAGWRRPGVGPVVVLVHGLTDCAGCWCRVAAALDPAWDLVAYDLRGHGRSEGVDGAYAPEDNAVDLIGLLGTLHLDQVVLLGHSLGAETSAYVAVARPDLVERLVLVDPPWNEDWQCAAPDRRQEERLAWEKRVVEIKEMTDEDALRAAKDHVPEAEAEPWLEGKRQFDLRALHTLMLPRQPWQSCVARLRCPTLLVTGDPERGALVSPTTSDEIRRLCDHVRVRHFPNAGHSVHRDCFEAFVAAATQFIQAP
jgi:N-formylmaleamate deformylase